MAPQKLFTNKSPFRCNVTLIIRRSEDPRDIATAAEFWLDPNKAAWQSYDDGMHIHLNSIKLMATLGADIVAHQELLITRGSDLDNHLTVSNAVDFTYAHGTFQLSTHQVHHAI